MFKIGIHYVLPGFLIGFIPCILLGLDLYDYLIYYYVALAFLWVLPPWGTARRKFDLELAAHYNSIVPSLMLGLMMFFGAMAGSITGFTVISRVIGIEGWKEKVEQLDNGTGTPQEQNNSNFQPS